MARKKNKLSLEFAGFEDAISRLEELGKDVKSITEEALIESQKIVARKSHEAMKKHHDMGKTEDSIVEDKKVEWTGLTAEINVGFDLENGGMPSIYLMYGTARHEPRNQYGRPKRANAKEIKAKPPDKAVFNAVYGKKTKDEVAMVQALIFADAINERMG